MPRVVLRMASHTTHHAAHHASWTETALRGEGTLPKEFSFHLVKHAVRIHEALPRIPIHSLVAPHASEHW